LVVFSISLIASGVGFGEVLHQPEQVSARSGRERLEFGEAGVGQGDEPADLDLHPAVHVALLAHQRAQRRQPRGVAAVQRRQRGNRGASSAMAEL
jgi:hypothetical protein